MAREEALGVRQVSGLDQPRPLSMRQPLAHGAAEREVERPSAPATDNSESPGKKGSATNREDERRMNGIVVLAPVA